MNHTLTCCLNGGGRKAGWQTRVRHGDDANLTRPSKKLTSLTNVSASAVDDLSPRPCLLWVGLGGEGSESRDRSVVECQVVVVGAVDGASEDWETVDSSRLIPTMAGYLLSV